MAYDQVEDGIELQRSTTTDPITKDEANAIVGAGLFVPADNVQGFKIVRMEPGFLHV
jgi:hypothetical protein